MKANSNAPAKEPFWRSRVRVFEARTTVPSALEDVFEFFSKAENLERLTPDSLSFEILSPLPIEMKAGTTIDYRLKLLGVPFRWQSVITLWDPPRLFADDQARGPYQLWHHEHRFAATESGTEICDRVEYRVAGAVFEPVVHTLFVKPQLTRIFKYRENMIRKVFG